MYVTMKKLNVVYIGPQSFPLGGATTKRRRYMIDYLNSQNIQSHYLVTDFKQRGGQKNPIEGHYGLCDYLNIIPLAESLQLFRFWRIGKRKLKEWHQNGQQNCIIFATILSLFEWPFYIYARKLGYKIVFDQVETSYLQNGNVPLFAKLNIWISERLTHHAFKNSAGFVISKALWIENKKIYPQRKLCLLLNSTPVLRRKERKSFNNPIRLLYSGTYAPKDGVEYLIDGVIEAHEKGCSCELFLLGKGNSKDMKILERYKEKEYIHYIGFVSDEKLKSFLLDSDILCMTRINSRFANYGFPFKLSEYLATGNVVLSTNVSDVCDYVENLKSAYIVPPKDSHAIAETILRIINNPQEAMKVAEGGLEAMLQNFSIEKVGQTFVNFLRNL